MKWIKASERLPELYTDVHAKLDDCKYMGQFREFEGEIYFNDDGEDSGVPTLSKRHFEKLYWLDESQQPIPQDILPIKEDGETVLRPCVKWFAEQMEKILRDNDHKGGWDKMGKAELMERLEDEVDELKYEYSSDEKIIKEAADVANFAMMIADITRKTPKQ